MKILILGMPNVGKTSLYNSITLDDTNIIHKTIGTTRDWHSSYLKVNNNIEIFDTPGIISKKNILENTVKELIKIIDIILYVVDYKNENLNSDKSLLKSIRKFGKDIILIVNKDDNLDQGKDFSNLGIKKIFYISCSHRIGINHFLDNIKNYTIKKNNDQNHDFSIGLFGKTNVGKSTLLNKLVGYERSLVSHLPKTTTDVVSSSFIFKNTKFLIKDTAGLIKKNKIDKNSLDYFVTKKTLSIINKIDVNIFLIDINQGFDTQSKKIFSLIYEKSNIILFLINKIDLVKKNKKKILSNLKKDIEDQFSQSKNIYILPSSNFNKKNIIALKKIINELTTNTKINISTSKINIWLKKITSQNPHPRINGREVKFKYITQLSSNPLRFKIFGNFSKEITKHYRRFLLNKFYSDFNFKSKNLKVLFSKSENPYT